MRYQSMRAIRHHLFSLCCLVFLFASCGNENETPDQALSSPVPEPEPIELHYGFNLDEFQVEGHLLKVKHLELDLGVLGSL